MFIQTYFDFSQVQVYLDFRWKKKKDTTEAEYHSYKQALRWNNM